MLNNVDPHIAKILEKETDRQKRGLEMIPSENYPSSAVLEALGSIFADKYSEGYPGKRYYAGNEYIDEVEQLAIDRAKALFGVPHANVQPYSGSPANFAVYVAVCDPGDAVAGLNLPDGGHLTHGWKVSATARFWRSVPYHVRAEDGRIDMDELADLVQKEKPKLLWAGATAYPWQYDFAAFAEIADSVGAYFAADIAHVAGLIAGGVHPSPVPHAHIVTTTTHKTLRGPRGGMIMVTEKGLAKDQELAEKIDKAVFPGLQGGPHDNQTAAIAVALHEAAQPEFKDYASQVVINARMLAKTLVDSGVDIVGGGTENHLLLIDLRKYGPGRGIFIAKALDAAGITVNQNTIPGEPSSPFYPSGVRLGAPAVTSRGMKETEMQKIGEIIARIVKEFAPTELPEKGKAKAVAEFEASLVSHPLIKKSREEVVSLASHFPVPGIDDQKPKTQDRKDKTQKHERRRG